MFLYRFDMVCILFGKKCESINEWMEIIIYVWYNKDLNSFFYKFSKYFNYFMILV